MAQNTVEIKIPATDIVKKAGEHTEDVDGYRRIISLSIFDSDTETVKTATSDFSVPLNLPKSFQITSIKFPMKHNIDAGNNGSSFALVVEGQQYGLDSSGNITDSNIINYINEYKANNGEYPELLFRIGSWVYREEGDTISARTALYSPIVTGIIEGSQEIYRPISDIETGHAVPDGFGGVYDLLDDEVADDESTQISTYGRVEDYEEITVREKSILKTKLFPNKKSVVQLRIIGRIYVDGFLEGNGTVRLAINSNNVSAEFIQEGWQIKMVFQEKYAWENEEYYTFEGVVSSDSELVKAINSYYRQYHGMPEVSIQVTTVGKGIYRDEKSDGVTCAKVSQVYIEAVFEDITNIGVYDKINSTYKAATAAYKKQGGTWTEIAEDECKSILKNNTIRSG